MNNNIRRDNLCYYGYYAYTIGLAANMDEKDCNNPGTYFFQNLLFCDEHYPLVLKSKKQKKNFINKFVIFRNIIL